MTEQQNEIRSAADLVTNSLLYRQAQAQREEILKHKWCESEKAGYDIGLEQAKADWTVRYRSQWFRWWLHAEQIKHLTETSIPRMAD